MDALLLVLTGALAGLLAGLVGIGGGLVTVPAMVWLLPRLGVAPEWVMHVAVATALTVIVPTALLSARSHQRRQAVDWVWVWRLAPVLALGSLLAVALAGQLGRPLLQGVFAVFAAVVALSLWVQVRPAPGRHDVWPAEAWLVGAGIGLWAALTGTGGGTLVVPYLHWRGLPLRRAVGTAAACGLPIALAGALGFALWPSALAGPGLLGLVHLPAAALLLLGSLAAVPWGVRLAHRLPVAVLRRVLALVLLLVVWRLWPA